jgi:hypothetical protein
MNMRTALKVSEIQVVRNLLQHENLYDDRQEYEKFVIRYLGYLVCHTLCKIEIIYLLYRIEI